MLKISNITKTFSKNTANEHTAIDDLSLYLQEGDFVTVIGSNGAGKSTLMNAISGSFWIDKGNIKLDGKDITYMKEHKRAKSIGRLFQDPMKGTAPDLTIEENLALSYSGSRRHNFNLAIKKQDRDYFRSALEEFDMGLENRLKNKMGLLSGGQRQAVTLLMSSIASPKLLLLDEHTAALDPAAAKKVLNITRNTVKKNNLTTLMITHNIKSALKVGNRTIMMNAGKIILDISGEERDNMTVQELVKMYSIKSHKELDNDRMLLSQDNPASPMKMAR
jgi:putative ABC transport system ATP-binding protein